MTGYYDHATVSQIRYQRPSLSVEDPIYLEPKGLWTPRIDASNIAYHSLFQPFDLKQYLYTRPPIDMGSVSHLLPELATDTTPNVLRLPLKFPKSSTWMTQGNQYCIPREMKTILPLITRIAEYEKFINPDHDDCFCHITYDRSVVADGTHHRFPGFHGDGIQGTKLTPKVNVEHSYILTSAPATEFCLQPFFLTHLDEAKHNYFLEFDRQAREDNVYSSLPNHLYLIDPYMVHRSPKMTQACARVFMRITYAFTELQHPKNTNNPLFPGQEYRQRIDIRENLMPNEFEVPWQLYGLDRKTT